MEGEPLLYARAARRRVVPSCRLASADLFGQGDDNARGTAEVAEPEDALVLRHLAEEFGAVGTQAGDGVVDVVDGEHDAMQAQRVGRRVLRLGADRRGGVVLRQLQLAVAVRGPHHRDVAPDAFESDGAVRPKAFDLSLAFQLHAELGEERDGGIQVFNDDGDVVHPLNGHVFEHKQRRAAGRAEEGRVLAGSPSPRRRRRSPRTGRSRCAGGPTSRLLPSSLCPGYAPRSKLPRAAVRHVLPLPATAPTVAESGKPYRLASRNDCAGAESMRYSRFGPAQRRLNVHELSATSVPSWNNAPPESPKQTLFVIFTNRSGKRSCSVITETSR